MTTISNPVHVGYKFILIRPIDRFPDFVAPPGLTGIVSALAEDVWAKMDQPVCGAEAWNNEVYWSSVAEFIADTRPLL